MAPVTFELDRLEVTDDARVEVAGRWFGVRGLRFVRPALILRSEDREQSLLADLEHKPWAAEDGGAWMASFPWPGGELDASGARLAVAPSVVVPLDGDGASGGEVQRQEPSLRERVDDAEVRARRLQTEVDWLRAELARVQAAREDASAEVERRERDLLAERDIAVEERLAVVAERDELAGEVERLRDAAAEVEDLRREVARLRDALARAERRAEAAPAAEDVARLRRAVERAEARAAEAEARAADAERRAAAPPPVPAPAPAPVPATPATDGEVERLRAEVARLEAERDAALARPSGVQPVPAVERPRDGRRRPLRREPGADVDWVARVLAIGAVVSFLLLLVGLLNAL